MSRNLAEYPISWPEVQECLERFRDGCDRNLIGDMRPTLINTALQILGGEVVYARRDGKFTYVTIRHAESGVIPFMGKND